MEFTFASLAPLLGFLSLLVAILGVFFAVLQTGNHMGQKLDTGLKTVRTELREEIHLRFDLLDQRMGRMDKRIDALDDRIGTVDGRIGTLEKRMDKGFELVHHSLLHLDTRVHVLTDCLLRRSIAATPAAD